MTIQTKPSKPSEKVSRLISEAYATKARVQAYLDAKPVDGTGAEKVRGCLRFLEESYAIFAERILSKPLDRTTSLLAGPLFVSNRHPHPVDKLGNGMFPVLQIDMAWLNLVCKRKFEPCMLQFWWDTVKCEANLRKVPLDDINIAEILPIQVGAAQRESGALWMPSEWNLGAANDAFQIIKCTPIGVTCPNTDSARDSLSDEYGDDADEPFLDDVDKFSPYFGTFNVSPSSKSPRVGTLFGSFYATQLAPADFSHDGCLTSFGWGGGHGTIFYDHDAAKGKTNYEFYFDK